VEPSFSDKLFSNLFIYSDYYYGLDLDFVGFGIPALKTTTSNMTSKITSLINLN
jgi:hypothetical protein